MAKMKQPAPEAFEDGFAITVENGVVVLWTPRDNEGTTWGAIAMEFEVALKMGDLLLRFAADAAPSEEEFLEAAEDAGIQGARFRPRSKELLQ